MRILFNLISILIIVLVIFIASLNTHTFFNFTFWVLKGTVIMYNVALAKVILTFFIVGVLAGIFWAASFYLPVEKRLREYQRKLEKTSVQTDEESSKVAVLEEKIKTLEKALQSALENKE